MQEIMNLTAQRKAQLADHPFYRWVETSEVPLAEKLLFAPIMANFVMNFRDMNLWFIRFSEASDRFKTIINGNTSEDETHSGLFLEDWKKLNLDQRLGWRASDVLWWLFLADDTEAFRAYAIEFARMTVADGGNPLLRFAHSEAGEACGNAFFTVVAKVATRLQAETGQDYRYFGEYHLNREKGHVIASEGVFEREPLSQAQSQKGVALASAMFDIFEGMHDKFLAYAQRYVSSGTTPRRQAAASPPKSRVPAKPNQPADAPLTPSQAEVQQVLNERKALAAKHPFYAWLGGHVGVTALDKLQRFVPMWVMDIMGYRDLNHFALRFCEPQSDLERTYNRWVESLETHSSLFLNDWDALGMDEALGWMASETLEFLFLDQRTDVHRRNIAGFIKLALAHPEPVLRFWLLEALEASGEAFFQNTKRLARIAEKQLGKRLDYLGDRHALAHLNQAADEHEMRCAFRALDLADYEKAVAISMVNTVFDALDEQLTLSLEVATSNAFRIGTKPSAAVIPRAYGRGQGSEHAETL